MKKIKCITRSLCLVIFMGCLLSCGASKTKPLVYKLEKRPPFTLGKAYYQQWKPDSTAEATSTYVHIPIEKYASRDVVITAEDIYFRTKKVKANKPSEYRTQYSGSVNHFVGYFENNPEQQEMQNSEPTTFPFILANNEAVLSYMYKGKIRYLKIPNLLEKKPLTFAEKTTEAGETPKAEE